MIIGIDIGTQGALALLTPEGELVEIADMPVLRDGPKNSVAALRLSPSGPAIPGERSRRAAAA
jgi:hypothetical protein